MRRSEDEEKSMIALICCCGYVCVCGYSSAIKELLTELMNSLWSLSSTERHSHANECTYRVVYAESEVLRGVREEEN